MEYLIPQEQVQTSIPNSKWRIVKRIAVRFILPLGLVYLCEYFINQGIVIWMLNYSLNENSNYLFTICGFSLSLYTSNKSG